MVAERVHTHELARKAGRQFAPSDICKNGHPRTPENTMIEANGQRRCLTCRIAQRKAPLRPALREDVCRNGHPRIPDNQFVDKHGSRRCLVCRREKDRNRGHRGWQVDLSAPDRAKAVAKAAEAARMAEKRRPTPIRPQTRPAAEIVSEALQDAAGPLTTFERIALGQARLRAVPRDERRPRFGAIVNAGILAAREREIAAIRAPGGDADAPLTPDRIIRAVAATFEVEAASVTAPNRGTPQAVLIRQTAFYALRRWCPGEGDDGHLSWDKIAALFKRDRETIQYGAGAIERAVEAGDVATVVNVTAIRTLLGVSE